MRKTSYICVDKAVNQLTEKNMQYYKESLLWSKCMYIILVGKNVVACMQYALPYEWNNRTTQTSLESLFFKQMLFKKHDGEA